MMKKVKVTRQQAVELLGGEEQSSILNGFTLTRGDRTLRLRAKRFRMMPNSNDVANSALRTCRIRYNVTQRELGRELNLSGPTISRLETAGAELHEGYFKAIRKAARRKQSQSFVV